jgi:hypothetical protein
MRPNHRKLLRADLLKRAVDPPRQKAEFDLIVAGACERHAALEKAFF